MKRFLAPAALVLLLCSLSVPAFGQGLFSTVTGTVSDSSGALIPGVTIKATAIDTGVVSSTVTNEAGAYNFANLLPGKYTISASLPGFQTKNLTDVHLSQNTTYRYNFELAVAGVSTQVEVSVSAGMILATQGASVGQVLNQQKVQDLPLVGNNILDLITVMAGVENIIPTNPPSAFNAFGRENTTFAGVRADNVSIVRDGIQMQDNRNPNGIYSITTINPDLVGEIRLILAPVDVELGRGNGSIQYTTRSGTNKYSGSAVWSFRNTALDPNTWTNNRNQTVPPNQPPGTLPVATPRNWTNSNQFTVSYSGPIVQNKTFFFALFDLNRNRARSTDNFAVPTACARLGIFRYFNGWGNGNVNTATVATGTAPTRPSVNLDGSPAPPTGSPTGTTPQRCADTMHDQCSGDDRPGRHGGLVRSDRRTQRTAQIVLQHAQPGKKGNLGNSTVVGLGSWRFDANLGKTFRISESKSLQVRFDAQNVLNHPQPGTPALNINGVDPFFLTPAPFGQITTKTGTRLFQGQMRLNF